MKKKINLIGLLLFMFVSFLYAHTPYFYYYGGQRQYLELDTRYIFISVADENVTNRTFATYNIRYEPLHMDIPERKRSIANQNERFWSVLSFEERMSDEAYLAKLAELRSTRSDLIVAPFFRNQYQDRIGLSNFFYVRLKDLGDTIVLKQKAERTQTQIMWQNEFMPLWFVMSVTANSKYNAMELANQFFQSGLFQYAEPDLMVDDSFLCASDQFFGNQWGLKNIGQNGGRVGVDIKACSAWQISTGNNVVVAVLDDGIDFNHPDLVENKHPLSYDSESGTSPQRLLPGSHGTPVAGIIGATKNSIGVAGVAPNSRIMSVSNSLRATVLSREARANGINWAWQNGADVINNSWGSSVRFQIIDDAVNYAVTQGRLRNGVSLGTVVVFASGNNNASAVNYPANLPNVIAVGAVDRCGIRSGRIDIIPNSCDPWGVNSHPGSAFGTRLDIVAPGTNVYTTDMHGRYTNFGGTSAAAPFVAGVAALVLSVNPNLTQAEVRRIIESTAQKVNERSPTNPNGYVYSITSGRPHGTWNNQVGHGLVDAYAAVREAIALLCVSSFIDQPDITTSTTITACYNLEVRNVTITNNATLTINAPGMVNITGDLVVHSGRLVVNSSGNTNVNGIVAQSGARVTINAANVNVEPGGLDIQTGAELEINTR